MCHSQSRKLESLHTDARIAVLLCVIVLNVTYHYVTYFEISITQTLAHYTK